MTASSERLSPLSRWIDAFVRASAVPDGFSIREMPFTTQINLRGNASNETFRAVARAVLGCDLPLTANTCAAGSIGAALWLGPDEWLFAAAPDHGDALIAALRSGLAGTRCAITDVSAARTVIEISGSYARLVLAKGCPLDLNAVAFAPPQCAQTLLAKARVVMQCVDGRSTFRLFVPASFAAYLAEWLTDAAAECADSRGLDTDRVASRLA